MQESLTSNKKIRIGLFDSGIGGFSILNQLFKNLPYADFYYFSDDENAPYGPKSDDFITERSLKICEELFQKDVDIIVVACNTATASSIDILRSSFPAKLFVGVEPYLNAYYKVPIGPKKMIVLTTESMGKSERFKRLKEKLDPDGKIEHLALKNLARLIEEFYFHKLDFVQFDKKIHEELRPLKNASYTHVILGCTHYPLIAQTIQAISKAETISPCKYVAQRVYDLLRTDQMKELDINCHNANFYFCSSKNYQWVEKNRNDFLSPFII